MRKNKKQKTLLAILLILVVSTFILYRLTKPEPKLNKLAKQRAHEIGKVLIKNNFEVIKYDTIKKDIEVRGLASTANTTATGKLPQGSGHNNATSMNPSAPSNQNQLEESLSEIKVQQLEGEIGRDPWGYPFHYQTHTINSSKKLIIWSGGADGKVDSRIEDLLLDKTSVDDLSVSIEM